jgi:hypothetical protein
VPAETLLFLVSYIPLTTAEFFHAGSRLAVEQDDEPGTIAEEHCGKGSDAAIGAAILLHHPHALAET